MLKSWKVAQLDGLLLEHQALGLWELQTTITGAADGTQAWTTGGLSTEK
ncbi:MAG: hypothetical protein R2753_11940 [Chitinophagales bacterium]